MTASVREIYLLFLKPAKIKGLFKNTIKGSLHPQARKLIYRLKKLWLFFNQDSQSTGPHSHYVYVNAVLYLAFPLAM